MSLYNDASLVMIPSAYKDGKLYSIRPVPEYGAEQVTNGDFATDSDWTKTANTTISGGIATFVTGTASLYQSIGVAIGNTYKVTYTIQSGSGSLFLSSSGFGGASLSIPSVIGINSVFVTATTTGPLYFVSLGSVNLSIDNVSVKEVIKADGDFTFSRGSNLAATRVDVNGLIEKGRENVLTYSNDFSNADWTLRAGVSVTGGQSGYDGTNNAWLLNADTTGTFRFLNQATNVNTILTNSIYAKAGSVNYIGVTDTSGSSSHIVYFNLSNGTIDSVTGGSLIVDYKIESVGNGWYRCSAALTAHTSGTTLWFVSATGGSNANAGDNVYIQNVQSESSLVATDYIETGASTAQAGILEDMPRLDYSGSCPALLLEPQRSNLLAYSEYFSASSVWLPNTITITDNYGTSPEGLSNSTRLVLGNLTASRIAYAPTLTDGTTYTFSCWYKGTAGEKAYMEGNGSGGSGTQTSKLITFTGDWQRENLQFVGGSSSNLIYIVDSRNGSEDSALDFEVWGAQLESGSYPTSYIPTYGSSVTRSAETSITSANTLGGLSVGTFFIEMARNGINTSETGSAVSLRDNAGAEELRLHFDAPASQVRWRDGNNSFAQIGNALPVTAGTTFKILIKSDGTTAKVFGNGVQLGGNYSIVSAFDFQRIYNYQLGYEIKQQLFFPTALTDSECIALTTI